MQYIFCKLNEGYNNIIMFTLRGNNGLINSYHPIASLQYTEGLAFIPLGIALAICASIS